MAVQGDRLAENTSLIFGRLSRRIKHPYLFVASKWTVRANKTYILFVIMSSSTSAQSQPETILGTWLTEDQEAHVEIFKSDDLYTGKIVWLKEPIDPKTGLPCVDDKNPDVNLRSEPMMGSLVLWGLRRNGDEYSDGKVYDSRDGSIYTAKIWTEDDRILKVRGYIGFFFNTETWTRVK